MTNSLNTDTTKSLTHEAKTHLTVIYGYLQLLQSSLQNSNQDSDKLNDTVDKIMKSCNQLSTILESIDNTSKSK